MTGPRRPAPGTPGPAPGHFPVPNPAIPDPILLDWTTCGTPFICDATSQAAREGTCSTCAIPGPARPPGPEHHQGDPG